MLTIAEKWTIAAIVIGPGIGVLLTFLMQHVVSQRQRRMNVFRDLMATRRMRLSKTHVEALNLVEVEFHRKKDVIKKWNNYREHLYTKAPEDAQDLDRFIKDQEKLLTLLVQSIGKEMGRQIEQLEIWDGGYVPAGWEQDEIQIRELRRHALGMLKGQLGLPVIIHKPSGPPENQYPPPPD